MNIIPIFKHRYQCVMRIGFKTIESDSFHEVVLCLRDCGSLMPTIICKKTH